MSADPLGDLPDPTQAPPPPAPRIKRPFLPSTTAILASLVIAFAGEAYVGRDPGVLSGYALMRMGALYWPAVQLGDFWRIGSYAFLHIGWLHILSNGFSIWFLAADIEMAYGSNLLLGAFSLTALISGLTSLAYTVLWILPQGHPAQLVAGASGGAFGLFGMMLAALWRIRHRLPPQVRRSLLNRVVFSLVVNVYIALSFPVDTAAHLGGLFSGALLGLLLPFAREQRKPWQVPLRWAVIGSAMLLAAMEGAAFSRAVKPKPRPLHGEGFEAQVEGTMLPIEPGIAEDPGVSKIVVRREATPLEIAPGQDAVRIGDRTWVRERSRNPEDQELIKLAARDGEGQFLIEFVCAETPCKGAAGDRMAEITARTIRPSP